MEQALRAMLKAANEIQQGMLLALAEERWDDLQQLDQRCRTLYGDFSYDALTADQAILLADSMRNFLDFHAELTKAVEVYRESAAGDLKQLRTGRKNIDAYHSVNK